MEQRSDIHQRKGGKRRERFGGEATGKVQETSHSPRSTIVPSALDEPFTEPEVFEGHMLVAESSEGSNASSLSNSSISGLSTADVPSADLDDEMDSGPPTQPRISILPMASEDSQARYEPVPVHSHVKEKFYLRLELRKDCLADLWVRDLTPHNVLAWSDGMESWVPLLTVPELRDAIRTAQDRKTRDLLSSSQPPPALVVPSSEDRIPLPPPRRAGSIVSAAPARAGKFWHMPHPRPKIGSGTIPAPPLSPQSSRPPPRMGTCPPPVALPLRSSTPPPALDQAGRSSVAPKALSVCPPPVGVKGRSRSSAAPKAPSLLPPPATRSSSAIPVPGTTPSREQSHTELRAEAVPDFPRPARVPSFVEPVVASPKPNTPAVRTANHGTLMPRSVSVVPAAHWSLRGSGLVNLERAVWLAAGISVATAASFVLRGSASGDPAGTSDKGGSAVGATTASGRDGSVLALSGPQGSTQMRNAKESRSSSSSESVADAAKVEDLPLVGARGAPRGATRSGPSVPSLITTPVRTAGEIPIVQADALALASQSGSHAPSAKPLTPASSPGSGASKPTAPSSDGAFDPSQARRVLASAAARARSCAESGLSGAVQVTFAPSGFVQGASLLNVEGEGVRSGCVLRAFQEARVSPFVGASVAVKKSFSFQ
jgi:hypothetical protein